MIYIRSNNSDKIEVTSIEAFTNYTCTVETLPSDYYFYLSLGKYQANSEGLYIVEGWVDYSDYEKEALTQANSEGKEWKREGDGKVITITPEVYTTNYPNDAELSAQNIEALKLYASNIKNWGATSERIGNKFEQGFIKSTLNENIPFEVDHFVMLMQIPYCEIIGFNPYVEVSELDINNEIPLGLPNRLDSEGKSHTWATWRGGDLGEPTGGNYYFRANSFKGQLSDVELMIIQSSTDAKLVNDKP